MVSIDARQEEFEYIEVLDKAVDDIVCGLFGEDNPRPLEDYQAPQPTMQMGGLSQ